MMFITTTSNRHTQTRQGVDTPPPQTRQAADTPPPETRQAADTPPPQTRQAADTPPPQTRQAADTPPPPPGANPQTMGGESAKAMSIGTGGSQQDKYSSSYSSPNYTQYTNNNYRGELRSHSKQKQVGAELGQAQLTLEFSFL